MESDIERRRIDYLKSLAFDPGRRLSPYLPPQERAGNACEQIGRLELERRGLDTVPLDAEAVRRSLGRMDDRIDCADFDLAALVRMLYRYPVSRLLDAAMRDGIRASMLRFTYWVDEPGCKGMIFSTENHQILYHSNELLVASLWPEETFSNNGRNGRWHAEHAMRHVRRWLDWRIRFGFSEWNSNCYYEEDFLAVLNLAEYAPDDGVRREAKRVADLILLHMAVNSFRGVFGSPHGRTYARLLLNPLNESTGTLAWMAFGIGGLTGFHNGATMLACSGYTTPDAVVRIARDVDSTFEARERHSLDMEEARGHGVDPSDPEDLMFFWGCQNFHHRLVIDASMAFCPEAHRVEYPKIKAAYDYYRRSEAQGLAWVPPSDHQGMSQANLYTWRSPRAMLSCAQDFRKGQYGWQAHVWQATLGDRAVVYTTHPGAADTGRSRPDYWHGNGIMPRAAACRNVALCLYRSVPAVHPAAAANPLPEILRRPPGLDRTHAFFPRYAFDEVREEGGWVMGRLADAYVGLWSLAPARWAEPDPLVVPLLPLAGGESPTPYELVADGRVNAWICELGDSGTCAGFDAFCASLAASRPQGDAAALRYLSPSLGEMSFGWDGPLRVGGRTVGLGPYPRMDNPFCVTEFDGPDRPTTYDVRHGDARHRI